MLSIVYAAVAHNIDRKKPVGEIGQDSFDNRGLVDDGPHRNRVVSWDEHQISERSCADKFALYVVVKSDVALRRRKRAQVSPTIFDLRVRSNGG